jgi:deoxyguanosine kinase
MLLDKLRYVVIEGPIGAGKTSLALRLARYLTAEILLEEPDDNPFLARFYQDPKRHALATQLFFLFQRAAQVSELKQQDMFARPTVADFLFDKDELFARLNLSDDELSLYHQVYRHLKLQVVAPDLVIYLQASTTTLIERVQRRGIDYEQAISTSYLAKIAEGYSRFFFEYDAAPLLIVNSDRLNLVDEKGDFDLLLRRIQEMRGPREFFSRGS